MCSWQGDTLCFTVDFALGFTCFDSKTKVRAKHRGVGAHQRCVLLHFRAINTCVRLSHHQPRQSRVLCKLSFVVDLLSESLGSQDLTSPRAGQG